MKAVVLLEVRVTYVETHLVEVDIESNPNFESFRHKLFELAKDEYLSGESVRESQEPVENQDYEKNIENKPLDVQFI